MQKPSLQIEPLVVGSGNRKKALELAALLEPIGVPLETLADVKDPLEVDETGDSFAENARLKAVEQAVHLHRWVLADDSGIVVDALGGAPGIYSARYAGPNATDEDNRQRLLKELEKVDTERRGARFVCHLVLADPQGQVVAECEEHCTGRVRREAVGSGGFGYDPLFEIVEYHRTFGELAPVVKSCLSHRARAMRTLLPVIQRLVESGEWGRRG